MILDSQAGSDVIPFRNKEFYGWAIPVVGQRSYQFRFASLIDWQTVRFRCMSL